MDNFRPEAAVDRDPGEGLGEEVTVGLINRRSPENG